MTTKLAFNQMNPSDSTAEFATVADMVASTVLEVGMRVRCLGYQEKGDGGDNTYDIVAAGTGTADGGSYIDLSTHQANGLFPEGIVNIKQFGAVSNLGGANTDNTTAIQNAITYLAFSNNSSGGVLEFPNKGLGYLSGGVNITNYSGLTIDMNGVDVQLIDSGTNNYLFTFTNCSDCKVINGNVIGTSGTVSTYNDANRQAGVGIIGGSNIKIRDVVFRNFISFGVHAEAMSPSTTIRGIDVEGCTFINFPLDATTNEQCGIHLVNGAEYCNTYYNHFQDVPCAQRDVGGANSNFVGNMVMSSNGQYNDNSAASVYSEASDNFGKYNISFNHVNHNDNGNRLLVLKGNPSNTRNPSYISHNQFLSNGTAINSNHIYLFESNKIQLAYNNIRENIGITSPTGQELVEVVDSNDITISDNFFMGADYAVTNNNSTINYGYNIFEGQDTGLEQRTNGGTHKLLKNRTYNLHVLSGHTIESTDDSNITISGSTVGTYAFSHSFGTENFNVQVTACESGTDAVFEVVKRSAVFDIFVTNSTTGAAIDREFNITITHGLDSDYPLDIV